MTYGEHLNRHTAHARAQEAGIRPDDVPTGHDGREHCPGCHSTDCLDCAIAAVLRHGWDT